MNNPAKIYTKLIYSFEGELLEEESFWYEGPVLAIAETQEVEGEAPSGEPEPTGGEEGVMDVLDYEHPDEHEEAAASTEPAPEPEPEKEFKTAEEVLAETQAAKEAKPTEEPAAAKPTEEPAKPVEEPASEPVAAEPPKLAEPAPEPVKTPDEMRADLLQQIEEKYQFTEEEATQLQMEPAKILPKVAAKMFVDVYEALYFSMINQMPRMINTLSTSNQSNKEAEGTFFGAYPELNKPEYAEQVGRLGKFWREQNKDASPEQAIKGIGDTAMAWFGLAKAPTEEKPPATPTPVLPSVPAAAKSAGAGEPKKEDNAILDLLDYEEPDF